ncbi:MAG: Aminopeptidase, partial [Planctomycetaceae bacterium]|nr:Aminopeptidase [Planctomycetaceae bacterium]
DDLKTDWDFSGFVVLGRFVLDLARDVANADQLPTWNPGDEFQRKPAKE